MRNPRYKPKPKAGYGLNSRSTPDDILVDRLLLIVFGICAALVALFH